MSSPYSMYDSGDYLRRHPTWHSEDAPWKASLVVKSLQEFGLNPDSICDVGCGAGGVLAELRRSYPRAELFGYDIASDAARFWPQYESSNIHFQLGDFFTLNERSYDVCTLLDIIEHLDNPFAFLSELSDVAKYYVLHIPLDLSALSVLREKPIIRARESAGHIHYFTKNLALSLMQDCGYEVVRWRYTGASFNAAGRTWKTLVASIPRQLGYTLDKDWGVRFLGGETLVVLAQQAER